MGRQKAITQIYGIEFIGYEGFIVFYLLLLYRFWFFRPRGQDHISSLLGLCSAIEKYFEQMIMALLWLYLHWLNPQSIGESLEELVTIQILGPYS